MTDFRALLDVLGETRFILVGGMAATVHGSTRLTVDVDVVYDRSEENLARMAGALAPHDPYLRGAPPGLPFRWDAETLRRGLNFTPRTNLGDLDLLGEIPGGGGYPELLPHKVEITLFGRAIRCLDLPTLIRVKRAAGRPRDLDTVAELEAILEESPGSEDREEGE